MYGFYDNAITFNFVYGTIVNEDKYYTCRQEIRKNVEER